MYHRTSRLVLLRGCTINSRNKIARSRHPSSSSYDYYPPSLLCSRFSDWTSSSTHTSSSSSGSASSSSSPPNSSWTTTALVLASSAVGVTTAVDDIIMPRRRGNNHSHHKTLNEPSAAAAVAPAASDTKTDNHDGSTNSTATKEDQDIIIAPKKGSRSKTKSKHRHSKRKKSRARSSTSKPQQQQHSDDTLFCGQWLQRQVFQPKVPYPAWDYNWDDRMTSTTTFDALKTIPGLMASRQSGVTRHILLIRHGQYDETYQSDTLRPLTKLGRKQAELTGLRLALWAKGGVGDIDNELFAKPCNIKSIYVSDMRRAKETAAIIAQHLPHVRLHDPDPLLNEALPSPMIPIRPDVVNATEEIDQHHDRIEQAYQKYFYRAIPKDNKTTNTQHDTTIDEHGTRKDEEDHGDEEDIGLKHEFEIIVGHGNVIRYFVCRALQIPPEAWLRLSVFNCSITYITIQPNGYVSVRLLGDVGHLRYDETTFSGNVGFHW